MTAATVHPHLQTSLPGRVDAPGHHHRGASVTAWVLAPLTSALAVAVVRLVADVVSSWQTLSPFERPIAVAVLVPVAVLTLASVLGTLSAAFWHGRTA